ncbi:uncharacterized protein TNCV_4119471 [Trichonephila clavipes]|nr:uncharacterized protein TNCV_4119471 [Trichonephila clavipes]
MGNTNHRALKYVIMKCVLGYLLKTEKVPHRGFRAHYEQLSEFKRGRNIEPKRAGWANRRIARHMGRSNAAISRCWQEWVENGKSQRRNGSG